MHLITGGAFNGKKQWVSKAYHLEEKPHVWQSFYQSKERREWPADIVVLEGIERFVRYLLEEEQEAGEARRQWQGKLREWLAWERGSGKRQLILIGTDMTKGVVPANAFDRMWRDAVGWCFQDAAEAANKVEQIWYGLPVTLKNKEEE